MMKVEIENQFKKAQNAYQHGNYQEIIQILNPICEKPVSIQINSLYVQALLQEKQYRRAYDEALNYELQYLNNPKLFDIWLTVLLHNELFIPARLSVNNYERLYGQSEAKKYLKMVKQEEDKAEKEQDNTIQQNFKNFYHIGDQPVWEQQATLNNADQLPLNKYLQGAQFILRDPFVKPIIRATILNTLIDLKVSQKNRFIWIDDAEHNVIPNQVDQSLRNKLTKRLQGILSHRLANDNPIDYQNYLKQLKIQLLLLTPFEDKVIKDSQVWIDVLLSTSALETKGNQIVKETIDWQQKIQNSLIESP